MADLKKFEAELKAEHGKLTEAYEQQLEVAEAEWAKLETAKTELTEFRSKYGRVIKALDEGAIEVKADDQEKADADA